MSRIGKSPIELDATVKVTIANGIVNLQGPKGTLAVRVPSVDLCVALKDKQLLVTSLKEEKTTQAKRGLTRAILANAAKGVAVGWERTLTIRGVGYRAELKGNQLHLALGFSHPVVFTLPEGVSAEVGKATRTEEQLPSVDLTLRSVDRQLLGQVAMQIRALRPPEPYKGKGIKFASEKVRRKEGKTGTA